MHITRSQYIYTSIINFDPYIDDIFALKTFYLQLANVVNLKPPAEINKGTLLPQYNQLLMDIYTETVFLKRKLLSNIKHLTMIGVIWVAILTCQMHWYE